MGNDALIRQSYTQGVRVAAGAAEKAGVDRWLSRRGGAAAFHARSLLALHDMERMVRLDVPWWTYKAIDAVDHFLAYRDGKARVFEWGAGASTVWLAQRAGAVYSVEHDADFVDQLKPLVVDSFHVDLRLVPPAPRRPDSTAVSQRKDHENFDFTEYAQTIHTVGGYFDLVVIDGRARSACLATAVPHLAKRGVIVFDNAARPRYQDAISGSGLAVELLRGWAPCLPYREATAILRQA